MRSSSRLSILFFAMVITACAPAGTNVLSNMTDDVQKGAACESFSGSLTSTLTQAVLDGQELPNEKTLRARLQLQLSHQPEVVDSVVELYTTMTAELKANLNIETSQDFVEAMTALEIGDQTTPEKAQLKAKYQKAAAQVRASAQAAGMNCSSNEGSSGGPTPAPGSNPMIKGATHALATAYQSCQAQRLPAMTSATEAMDPRAIQILPGMNGAGKKRIVGDLKLLQETHYYIREGIEKDASCFNVTQNPLIYDYGGKPYATTDLESTLNFFKDSGSGQTVLGVDCSGYVFASLASGGLRISPKKRLQASLVYGISAKMYMDPVANGLTCFDPVVSTATSALKDGDVLASEGHVVMIDRVGTDPFGINNLMTSADCTLANISSRNFDFDVLQSAPVKGGIGIDRMRASSYFPGSTGMQTALYQYAIAACKAHLGQSSTVKPATARLIRHKMTAECMDRPVKLEHESCVASCQ